MTELTINFGGGGNSLGYLGGGWARAEETFTWAIGQESHLLLPLGKEPREFVLMMNVIPFVHPPALSTQRLIVSVDETTIGMTSLSRPTVLAWRIPVGLIRRAERTLVTFWHPDAARPKDLSAGRRRSRSRILGLRNAGVSSPRRHGRRPSGSARSQPGR